MSTPRRPRVLTTTRLLTVAAVATGCSTSQETVTSDPSVGHVASAPGVTGPSDSGASGPGAMARPPVSPPSPDDQPTADRPLVQREPLPDPQRAALERDLEAQGVRVALGQPRFRVLCDASGYPLPGNLRRKSGGASIQVRDYCKAMRSR